MSCHDRKISVLTTLEVFCCIPWDVLHQLSKAANVWEMFPKAPFSARNDPSFKSVGSFPPFPQPRI